MSLPVFGFRSAFFDRLTGYATLAVMSLSSEKIFATLAALNIPFTEHTHPAVFTSAEAAQYYDTIPGAHVKNLFLRNRKGDRHYLVVVLDHKQVNLKALEKQLGEKQLGFASAERLQQYLQVTPGSVSALGVVYDHEHAVHIILDADIESGVTVYDAINLHPNDNTKTLTITLPDFLRFLEHCKNAVQRITL